MVHNAINQLLQTTAWGELDYLIIDLPPGTSDAPLTIMQVLDLDGFIVVTTPQELSKVDAKRSINMIRKLQVNVLGVVENFSGEIFGTGAGEEIAREMDLQFLGAIQLRPEYRDTSKPTILTSEEVEDEYKKIAKNAIKALESAAEPA
jgi:ATP-binding protein involved in chromosome partitioning